MCYDSAFWDEHDRYWAYEQFKVEQERANKFLGTLNWTTEQSLKFNRIIMDIERRFDVVMERRK